MATLVHFDIPSDDPERAKKFYADLFGWTFELVPAFQYNLFTTKNPDGSPGVRGGLGKRMAPDQRMQNYFGVPSLDAAMAQVKNLGGKVVSPKRAVPGMGYLANCMDTEGNSFGLWQEDPGAK
jgi:predicted enzyme related to lactoylglutathione lyase